MKECAVIRSKIGARSIYRRTGLRIDPYFSGPKILWMKCRHPRLYQATKFLTVHDLIVHALTGIEGTDET
jgi:xylulokinase/glycerol kinase